MTVENCTRQDFEQILADIVEFWGTDATLSVHHPTLVEEFGSTAFVVRDGGRVVGYLFGYFAQGNPYFYIHLVAVRDSHKGQGIASKLYRHVEQIARAHGMSALKAITGVGNTRSMAFHQSMGFELTGNTERNGVRYVENYSGPGKDRVVMVKSLVHGGA
jgi:GNAT superfamily N-acetyltransferase